MAGKMAQRIDKVTSCVPLGIRRPPWNPRLRTRVHIYVTTGWETLFGVGQSVTPVPALAVDEYSVHQPGPSWSGGSYTIRYNGSVYPKEKMPTCAYQFRLTARKRTTNGYGLTWSTVTAPRNITIQRT